MTHELLHAARAEEQALEAQLAGLPVFQRLQAVRRIIELYANGSTEPVRAVALKPSPHGQGKSQTAIILAAAVAHLRESGKRATSGALVRALAEKGVQVGGKKPSATLASYLSHSALFDNVAGEGYGLKDWGPAPGDEKIEAPDSGKLPGASANHVEA